MKIGPLSILRLLLSFLLLIAVAILMNFLIDTRPGFSYWRFFSFFTNQSNILVAIFFLYEGLRRWQGRPLSPSVYDRTRGALILYMSMTSSIYWLFLHHLVHIDSLPAYSANIFLHTAALTFLVYDLWQQRPETRMCKRFFVIWMLYPLLYCVAIMIAGSIQAWYPYPFLNLEKLGLMKWILWNGSMAVGIGGVAVAIILGNNRLLKTR